MPWEHFLQLIDTGNGNGVLDGDATRRFLRAVVDNDFLWQTPYTAAALEKAGLPGDREELREMAGTHQVDSEFYLGASVTGRR